MKNCIILLLALTVSTWATAQENVSIGPLAGVSIANLRGDIANNSSKAGLTIGGFYNYSSESGFGFSGQILYTQLGAKTNFKANEINLNYLQVPIFATFFFGKFGDRVRPKIFLGPSFNFLLNAKNENGDNINGDSNNRNYKGFDLGATAGAGLNFRLQEKIWLNVDVRYGLGLIDVTTSNSNMLKNGNLGINAGLSFPFGTYNKNTGRIRKR